MINIYKLPFSRYLIALFYTGIIFVGSIHLGWHYALDGYVGIVMSWMVWILAKRLTDSQGLVKLRLPRKLD